MKKLLGALLLLTNVACFSQTTGVRLFFQKPNQFNKQTIIAFSDTTTNGADNCCDALMLAGSAQGIWTYINGTKYTINTFAPLEVDNVIQLGTSASPDTGAFIIGVDQYIGDTLDVAILDELVPGIHSVPYSCQGPVSGDRFSLFVERPLSVEVVEGCEIGYVAINNDEPSVPYQLTNQANETLSLPATADTIYDLPSGTYTLCVYDDVPEQYTFTIVNTVIDATLYLPYTTLYIGDSYVTPILNIYSSYDSIEWDFGDGTIAQNDINPIHYYTSVGTYTLRASVSEGECTRIFEATITVSDISNIQYVQVVRRKPTDYYYAIDGKLIRRQ
jgi:PKD repeat protein